MRIINAMEKMIETFCLSGAEKQSRREFFLSLVPWTRKGCKVCGESHAGKGDLCPTCAKRYLTRISHKLSTAAADKPMSTASRSKKVLDVALATPPRFFLRVPCSHGFLRRLVTTVCEKCGLVTQ